MSFRIKLYCQPNLAIREMSNSIFPLVRRISNGTSHTSEFNLTHFPPINMFTTCVNVDNMSKMIQLRNVPEPLHRTLKSRAAIAGLSLSDYLIRELRDLSERPTPQELRQRVQNRQKVELQESPADALRAERDARP